MSFIAVHNEYLQTLGHQTQIHRDQNAFLFVKYKNRAGQAFKVTEAYLCRRVFLVSLTSRWKMGPADERCIRHLCLQIIKLY